MIELEQGIIVTGCWLVKGKNSGIAYKKASATTWDEI